MLLTLQVVEPVQWGRPARQRDDDGRISRPQACFRSHQGSPSWDSLEGQPLAGSVLPRRGATKFGASSKLDRARSALYQLVSARCGLLEEEVQLLVRLH